MNAKLPEDPGIRFPPPLIFLGFMSAGIAIDTVTAVPFPPLPNWPCRGASAAAVIAGVLLVGSALRLFRRACTRPEPWLPASALTMNGIYRRTRNPMYLGMALVHAGIAVAIGSAAALLLLIPAVIIVDRLVIRTEETYLSSRFGRPYLDYMERVRRWL